MASRLATMIHNIKSARTRQNMELAIKLPIVTGAAIGGALNGIEGFHMSKNDHILENTIQTTLDGAWGIMVGGFLGALWFVSIPVIYGRICDREKLDMSIFQEKTILNILR